MTSTASHSDLTEGDHCFFGKITGEEAADILKRECGGSEGSWLVRESISSPGNYVLTVVMDGQPQHILVHRHTSDDAVFSLTISPDAPVFHGLDTLIQHYCSHPLRPSLPEHSEGTPDPPPPLCVDQSNSFTGLDASPSSVCAAPLPPLPSVPYTLQQACYQDSLPSHTRLHGSCNLLHRAVTQENLVVVQELLQSGYRKVDARNPQGLSALHLACLTGNEAIVQELLAAGAKVKVRDSEGLSPLHYVCRLNKASLFTLLVTHEPSAVQWRAPANAEVALHEAAASRSLACVEQLLQCGAPSRPRNTDNQTPGDLAALHTSPQIVALLENHKPPHPRFLQSSFLHGVLSREECHNFLVTAEQDALRPQLALVTITRSPSAASFVVNGTASSIGDGLGSAVTEGEDSEAAAVLSGVEPASDENEAEGVGLVPAVTVFLVRMSTRTRRHVLSLRHSGQTLHFEILRERDDSYCIDDGPLFPGLESLVDHYTRYQDGLPALLTVPVAPATPPPPPPLTLLPSSSSYSTRLSPAAAGLAVPGFSRRPSSDGRPLMTPEPVAADTRPLVSPEPSDTQLLLSPSGSREDLTLPHTPPGQARVSKDLLSLELQTPSNISLPDSISTLRSRSPHSTPSFKAPTPSLLAPPPPQRQPPSPTLDGNRTSEICGVIDPSSLSVGASLGMGEFGSVLRGVWVSPAGDQIPVAVKRLHSTSDITSHKQFLQEAKLMMNLNHPYIVKLLGVCHGPPVAMVQELAAMGALLDHLLDHQDDVDPKFHLKLWPAQVALGMQYLEKKRFVHRDLACRNLLLSSPTLVKITDFGLSRATGTNTDYYRASQGGKWPLKWYAPESINYGRFTHSSDVWSYGVTLWEMYTFGDQPYGELPGYKVVELLERGERLPQPAGCSAAVYSLMLRCWHLESNQRPAFDRLAHHFSTGADYVDVKPYLKTKG